MAGSSVYKSDNLLKLGANLIEFKHICNRKTILSIWNGLCEFRTQNLNTNVGRSTFKNQYFLKSVFSFREVSVVVCLTVLSVLVVNSTKLFAAPYPATSSSVLLDLNKQFYLSKDGFSIHAQNTDWLHLKPKNKDHHIATVYRAPRTAFGAQAALTVRVDKLRKKLSVKRYVKKWKKDYPRLGFDILSARKIKVGKKKGFLIDLYSQSTARQMRQVVFLKNKTAVILTCRDHKKNFRTTVKTCNQIIRNFHWL